MSFTKIYLLIIFVYTSNLSSFIYKKGENLKTSKQASVSNILITSKLKKKVYSIEVTKYGRKILTNKHYL